MNPTASEYAVLGERNSLTFHRTLPARADTVWSWLTEAGLRRQWLADGQMNLAQGSPFELVWRNDQLCEPVEKIGAAADNEHSMKSTINAVEPGRLLGFTWPETDGVTITLESRGDETGLTLIHKALRDQGTLLNIAAGWHAHLDILASRLRAEQPAPFWDAWRQYKADYEQRIAA